jgi:hypothetical protein
VVDVDQASGKASQHQDLCLGEGMYGTYLSHEEACKARTYDALGSVFLAKPNSQKG